MRALTFTTTGRVAAAIVMGAGATLGAAAAAHADSEPPDALHFLAPFTSATEGDAATFDSSLLPSLAARICVAGTSQCETLVDRDEGSRLVLEPRRYVISWRAPAVTRTVRFTVTVSLREAAGRPAINLGSRQFDLVPPLTYTVGSLLGGVSSGPVPRVTSLGLAPVRLLFAVDRHVVIRARQLAIAGAPPATAAGALTSEFPAVALARIAALLAEHFGLDTDGVGGALVHGTDATAADVAVALRDGLSADPVAVVRSLSGAGVPLASVAQAVNGAFTLPAAQLAQALVAGAGLDAEDATPLADALDAAGIPLDAIADALEQAPLGLLPAGIARALVDGADAALAEAAAALRDGLELAPGAIAAALDEIGATLDDLAAALLHGLDLDATATTRALADGGVVTLDDATAIAHALLPLGVSLTETARALADVLSASASDVAQALVDGAGATFTATALALRDALGASAATIAAAIDDAGASLTQSVDVLANGLSLNPLEAAQALADATVVLAAGAPALADALVTVAGAALPDVAAALSQALQLSAGQVADALVSGARATYDEAASALRDGLAAAGSTVAAALADAGANLRETLDAVGTAFALDSLDLANVVADGLGLDAGDAAELVAALQERGATLQDTAQAVGSALETTATQLADALEAAFTVAPEELATVFAGPPLSYALFEVADGLEALGQTPTAIAQILQRTLGSSLAETVDALRRAGNGVTVVAPAVASAFEIAQDLALATGLQAGGFLVNDVVRGVRSVFLTTTTVPRMAEILHTLLFDGIQTAGALHAIMLSNIETVADVMHDVGYSAIETARGLESTFDAGLDVMTQALLDVAGYSPVDVASAHQQALGVVDEAITYALLAPRLGPVQTVVTLAASTFDTAADEAARVLDEADATATQILDALESAYGIVDRDDIALVLDDALITAQDIADILDARFGPFQIAGTLNRALGLDPTEIAGAVEDVLLRAVEPRVQEQLDALASFFAAQGVTDPVGTAQGYADQFREKARNLLAVDVLSSVADATAREIVEALKDAYGASAREIARAVTQVLEVTPELLGELLSLAGFAESTVDDAVSIATDLFEDLGEEIEDAFSDAIDSIF